MNGSEEDVGVVVLGLALKLETVCVSETLVCTCESTQRYSPGKQHRCVHCREDLESDKIKIVTVQFLSIFPQWKFLSGFMKPVCVDRSSHRKKTVLISEEQNGRHAHVTAVVTYLCVRNAQWML
jgi:hypothetical protein